MKYLLIDIGAGTMDILFYDDHSDQHYKAVVKSPVRHLAETAAALPGNLVVTGCEMGGGTVSSVLKERAQFYDVAMIPASAATIHHDTQKVQSAGIRIVTDDEAKILRKDPEYRHMELADLSRDRLKNIIEGLGISFSFDILGVCAQDHGVAAPGISHLDFRHRIFKQALDTTPFPHALLYEGHKVPHYLNRLTAISETAKTFPAKEVYVMDSGMAAILGSSMDEQARSKENILIMDVATSHTLGAALKGDEIAGFFEYHTRDITPDRLENLLKDLADGNLSHEGILKEGGHGAYLRQAFGFENTEAIISTGPKRKLAKDIALKILPGAPWGDNMMTGTVGLLEAIRRHKGLAPRHYY